MNKFLASPRPLFLFLLLLMLMVAALAGCSTTDSENASERPWDSPKSWENGLPSSMMEGR
jgi:outer membrane protein assembly factor BamE (lipoprotein component of BamABCDE complex)